MNYICVRKIFSILLQLCTVWLVNSSNMNLDLCQWACHGALYEGSFTAWLVTSMLLNQVSPLTALTSMCKPSM